MSLDPHSQRILILDFGSQYTQLIARRVREQGVYSEIFSYDVAWEKIADFAPQGVILSGGSESEIWTEPPVIDSRLLQMDIPVLGIGCGFNLLIQQLGGKVEPSSLREPSHARIQLAKKPHWLSGLMDIRTGDTDELNVWMSHDDCVCELPAGFRVVGQAGNATAAVESSEQRIYGLQFHPEVTHTLQGFEIIRRFVIDICGCEGLWKTANIINESVQRIRQQVGQDKVLLGLSGGVDSSVVAALLHKAIGDQLTCVFVDHGLLRLNEGDQVMETFAQQKGIRVIRVNAQERFFKALAGEVDPERKRKIIGHTFIDVFDEESTKLKDVQWLAQGTIYPDVIESAGTKTGKKHVVKSHHNVGGLPETMALKLLEPLRDMFKDEVRRMGVELGLPPAMVYRHPFPGPGLGVRILGEIKQEYADLLRLADAIYMEELHRHDLYDKVSQAFAVFLPIRSVGVTGSGRRRYDYVIALRAVETVDFMTAHWARLPYDFLDVMSERIIREIDRISRVVYDISGKPPATIEWE